MFVVNRKNAFHLSPVDEQEVLEMKGQYETTGFDAAQGAGVHKEVAPTITTVANTSVAVLNTCPKKAKKEVCVKRGICEVKL